MVMKQYVVPCVFMYYSLVEERKEKHLFLIVGHEE